LESRKDATNGTEAVENTKAAGAAMNEASKAKAGTDAGAAATAAGANECSTPVT
jgi:hypothetical protein